MRKITQFLIVFATICLVVTTMASAADVYKIGVILPLTGDIAVYGLNMQKGVDLAIRQMNEKGGKDGVKFKAVHEDNQGSAANSVSAIQKLINVDHVQAIVGAAQSTETLAICPIANENKVVLSVPGSTAAGLTTKCGSYTFRVIASDAYQGVAMANLIWKLKYQKTSVMFINNDYGRGLHDIFMKAFENKGGKVLVSTALESTGKDFRTELLKVKESGSKVVAFVGNPATAGIIFRQAKELGMNVQWVSSEATKAPETIAVAGDAIEGVLTMAALVDRTTPIYIKFKNDFKALNGYEPRLFSDFTYDATMMVLLAIKAKGYSGPKIKKGMLEIGRNYSGVTGIKTFDEHRNVAGNYETFEVKNGKYVSYKVE